MQFRSSTVLVLATFSSFAFAHRRGRKEKQKDSQHLSSSRRIKRKAVVTRERDGADVGILDIDTIPNKSLHSNDGRMLGVTHGIGSCETGLYPCSHADNFFAGDSTCRGTLSCRSAGAGGEFRAGDESCTSQYACFFAGLNGYFAAGNETCQGIRTGEYAGYAGGSFKAGSNSCNKGSKVCYQAGGGSFEVGYSSCWYDSACWHPLYNEAEVKIGDESCRGKESCRLRAGDKHVSFTIGNNSCNCEGCCKFLKPGSFIGDCQCNSLEDNCSEQDQRGIRSGSCPLDLTFDKSLNLLGLTNSNVTVDLSHLASSGEHEAPDLVFSPDTNVLSIEGSNSTVDLSHLTDNRVTQELQFEEDSLLLGMTESTNDVDLSFLVQDLSLNDDNILDISNGASVDLSSLRVSTLQGSVSEIKGKATMEEIGRLLRVVVYEEEEKEPSFLTGNRPKRERIRGSSSNGRRRMKNDKDPRVQYCGQGTYGWAMISSGRLIGMSIVINEALESGILQVGVIDCSNRDLVVPLGDDGEVLTVGSDGSWSQTLKFAAPVYFEAGTVLCFEAHRIGEIRTDKENAASLVLSLEQW